MSRTRTNVAAVLALVIGALSVIAGGQVLLGRDPGYAVIGWLPIYNVITGAIALLGVAPLIWSASRYALPLAVAAFGAHAAVMLLLQVMYREIVAAQSIGAMALRLLVWMVILILLRAQLRLR